MKRPNAHLHIQGTRHQPMAQKGPVEVKSPSRGGRYLPGESGGRRAWYPLSMALAWRCFFIHSGKKERVGQ